jgi:hypothetical protein
VGGWGCGCGGGGLGGGGGAAPPRSCSIARAALKSDLSVSVEPMVIWVA